MDGNKDRPMMRVVFRADASTHIGTGHVMRCLALAAQLREGGSQCTFAMRALPGHLLDEVSAWGFEAVMLRGEGLPFADIADEQADARELAALLGGRPQADWLVTDHYGLGAAWHRAARPLARRILAIDDLADRSQQCDVLLDQNMQAAGRYDSLVAASTLLLLGPAFALLRDEFAAARARSTARTGVLVSFGGADEHGVAMDAVLALERCGVRDARIVAGARNPHLQALQAACARLGYECLASTSEMARCMSEAMLAIGAGGTTMTERFAAGLPAVVVPIAQNQRPGSLAAQAAGAIALVDVPPPQRVAAIAAAVRDLLSDTARRNGMALIAAGLCDGMGARRVATVLQQLTLEFRPATAADAPALHEWRNAPETREHSGDAAPIPMEDHRRWLAAVLADASRRIWIAELNGMPVGVVRFDSAAHPQGLRAVISVYRVPGTAGRGWGAAIIAAGVEQARAVWPGLAGIDARISPDNRSSLRAFAACGFVPGGEPGIHHLLLRSAKP